MEERVRPAVGEMPIKRARVATEHVPTLGPLTDTQATSILRLLPVLTQLRVVPLVSRSWNRLLWASVLEQLDLQPFKEKINDAITTRLLAKCTQLKTLSLKHCSITEEVTTRLPASLKHLDLSWCNKLNADALRSLPALQTLNLSWCSNVKDVSMQYLPTSLTVLKLGGCADLTDEGVKLLERLSSLTTLQISGCEKVSNRILAHIQPSLRVLELFTCPNISDEDLRKLPPRIHVLGRVWPELKVLRPTALAQLVRIPPGVIPEVAAPLAVASMAAAPLHPDPYPGHATTMHPSTSALAALPPLHLNPTPTPPVAVPRPSTRSQTQQQQQAQQQAQQAQANAHTQHGQHSQPPAAASPPKEPKS